MKITRLDSDIELETYLPYLIEDECPECGQTCEITLDRRGRYLSYPRLGVPYEICFICEGEEEDHYCEWTREIVIDVSLKESK